MRQLHDAKRVRSSAHTLYGNGQAIWDPSDRWNAFKRAEIDAFARKFIADRMLHASFVLDVGCGSQAYCWLPNNTFCLDRFPAQLVDRSRAVAGDVEQLPFKSDSIDFLICVASVVNYVSAAEAISEIARVLRKGGILCLHFETSTSFEHLGSRIWGSNAACIKTLNAGREDMIWVYNPSYIESLLEINKLNVMRTHRFHIGSAIGLRLGLSQNKAALLTKADRIFSPFARFSDDIILLAEKYEIKSA